MLKNALRKKKNKTTPPNKKTKTRPTKQNKPGMRVYFCNLSYSEGGGRRLTVQGQLTWEKFDNSQNKLKEKGFGM
jgi:hypothetical protein